MKDDDKEFRAFLDLVDDDSKARSDITQCYNYITTNYLNETLTKLLDTQNIKEEEKKTIMKQLPNKIKKIIESLNPLYQCLTPSMNINDSIKVKKLKDNSFKSEVVLGFAMTKQACLKNMGESKEKANILLLDFDLHEHEIRELFGKDDKKENKKNKKDKNNADKNKKLSFSEDMYKKIESLDVNIILISKGIDYKLLEKFTEKSESNSIPKPIIAINIKSSSLEKIEICTKAKFIKSLEEFNNCIKEKDADNNKNFSFLGK